MKIETKTGSATSPRPDTNGVMIAHLCNHVGGWGSGFVLAVDDLSSTPRKAYKRLAKACFNNIPLGETQFVFVVEEGLWVTNMIAQNGLDKSKVANGCLVDYNALQECLKTAFRRAVAMKCNVHIPDGMGSGLAGGNKQLITDMIKSVATCTSIYQLEQTMNFIPIVTLWEFTDTTASSYVGDAAPADDSNDVVAGVQKALDDFRGIDLSDV